MAKKNSISNEIPLCVDLDGTLLKTDISMELLVRYCLTRMPYGFLMVFFWLVKGGLAFVKMKLAKNCELNLENLPYNQEVIDYILEQKKLGRKILLVTGSSMVIAQKIADYFGFFDDVHASSSTMRLIGKNKRDFLIKNYGDKKFDYIGNEKKDLAVWEACHSCLVVTNSEKLKNITKFIKIFDARKKSLFHYIIKQLKYPDWLKNLLLFAPIILSQGWKDFNQLSFVFWGFLSFSLMASFVYILNDFSDLPADRAHPQKKNRPLASGNLPILEGFYVGATCLILSLSVACFLLPNSIVFIACLTLYFAANIVYSLWVKNLVFIDLLMLTGFFILRIYSGGVILNIEITDWLYKFSFFLFLSLSLLKRFNEIKNLRIFSQVMGRNYQEKDLPFIAILGFITALLAIWIVTLYPLDTEIIKHYSNIKLFYPIPPLLFVWITRIWYLAYKSRMLENPISFASKDIYSLLTGVTISALVLMAQ
jgi:4-hydroxybenzoate polyprenyltransferase